MANDIIITVKTKDQASSAFKGIAGSAVALNQGLELAKKAFSALSGPFQSIVATGSNFTKQMASVASVTKLTSKEFSTLTAEAKNIGATTSFSATQAGEAMEELARAGMGVSDIMKTTRQAMDLSAATGYSLAQSAKLVAVNLNLFKESGADATQIVDLLNKTTASSPQEIGELGEALKNSAQIASSVGMNFQQTTAILGVMANTGLKGADAGTALKIALSRLLKPTKDSEEALTKYGISLDSVNPKTNSFSSILAKLNAAQMSEADIMRILGEEAGPKFIKMIGLGSKALDDMAQAQNKANTAQEAARIRMDNLAGDVTILESSLEGLKLQVFDSFDNDLRGITQGITGVISSITSFIKANKPLIDDLIKTGKEGIQSFVKDFQEVLEREDLQLLFKTAKDAATEFLPAIQNIGKAFTEISNSPFLKTFREIFIAGITVALDGWRQLFALLGSKPSPFDDLGIAFSSAFESIASWIDEAIQKIGRFFDALSPSKNANKMLDWLSKNMDDVADSTGDAVDGLFDFAKESFKAGRAALGLSGDTEQLDEANKSFDHTLTGNSVVPSLRELNEELKLAARNTVKFKQGTEQADSAAIKFDGSLSDFKKKESAQEAKQKEAAAKKIQEGRADTFEGMGQQLAGKITGVGAFVETFQKTGDIMSALGAGIFDLFMSNEKIAALFGRLNTLLAEIIDPIAEAIAPALEALAPILQELKGPIKLIASLLKPLIDVFFTGPFKLLSDGINYLNEKFKPLSDAIESLTKAFENSPKEEQFKQLALAIGAIPLAITAATMEIVRLAIEELNRFFTTNAGIFTLDSDDLNKKAQKFNQDINTGFAELETKLKGLFSGEDGLPNIFMKKIDEGWKSLFSEGSEIVTKLKDAITGAFDDAVGKASGFLTELKDRVGEAFTSMFDAAGGFPEKLKEAVGTAFNLDQFDLSGMFDGIEIPDIDITAKINDMITLLFGPDSVFGSAFNSIGQILSSISGFITETLNNTLNSVIVIFDTLAGILTDLQGVINSVSGALWGAIEQIASVFNQFLNILKGLDPTGGGTLGDIIDLHKKGVEVFSGGAVKFHNGGVVHRNNLMRLKGMNADEGLALLQAGETVIPKNQSGMVNNITINVNAIDPRSQAEEIRQILEELSLTGRLQVA